MRNLIRTSLAFASAIALAFPLVACGGAETKPDANPCAEGDENPCAPKGDEIVPPGGEGKKLEKMEGDRMEQFEEDE